MSSDSRQSQDQREATLLKLVAAQDRAAFEALFHAYERKVFRYVLSLVREVDVAEELTDDVMVEVWRGAQRFAGRSKPSTWILGIAHHKAIDALRRRRPRVVELHAVARMPDDRPGPDSAAITDRERRMIEAGLETLSADHRAVLQLAFAGGFSQAEIAAIVGCPVNTVKTRTFYAKQQLRKAMERLGMRREIS